MTIRWILLASFLVAAFSCGDSHGTNDGNGGSGGMAGDFGTLTLSGRDTAVTGTAFVPNTALGDVSDRGFIDGGLIWTAPRNPDSRPVLTITFVFGEAIGVTLSSPDPDPPSLTIQRFTWGGACENVPCDGIQFNIEARSASFENVTLDVSGDPTNSATASITLNGTLTW